VASFIITYAEALVESVLTRKQLGENHPGDQAGRKD
jgi:hypothetical protein